jgi:hypothetical protein
VASHVVTRHGRSFFLCGGQSGRFLRWLLHPRRQKILHILKIARG